MAEAGPFDDNQAKKVLADEGLTSAWLRSARRSIGAFVKDSHTDLSQAALDAHVNSFSSVYNDTPYISLSAGCRELDPAAPRSITYGALETALTFATRNGEVDGYVFRLWVLVSPKPAPELPGFGEEVRELNLFSQYSIYHHE